MSQQQQQPPQQASAKESAEGWGAFADAYRYFEVVTKKHADTAVGDAVALWLQRLADQPHQQPSASAKPIRVLDVASGSGVATISALEVLAASLPEGTAVDVLATDFSEDMLVQLRKQEALQDVSKTFPRLKATLATKALDMQNLEGVADSSVDLLIMTFGLMFVPDPVKALREVRRVLVPTGVAVVQTWHYTSWSVTLSSAIQAQGLLERDEDLLGPIMKFGSQAVQERYFADAGVKFVSSWNSIGGGAECFMKFIQREPVELPTKVLAVFPKVNSMLKPRFGGMDVEKAAEHIDAKMGEKDADGKPTGTVKAFGTSLAAYLHL